MTAKKVLFMLSVFVFFLFPFQAFTQDIAPETSSVTKHSIAIGGKTINYTATAGTILIRDEKEKPQAHIFYIAYTKDGVTDKTRRPILFSFNGGPGSSSVWMHMGFLGPRRVLYDDEGFGLQPPYRLEDNVHSILDQTDLVFIDPVATGFSRMVPGEDEHKFHGVDEDIQSVGEFIRLYVTRHQRWGSPKFIIGESYGTTRAAGLTAHLQNRHRMYINGTILVSTMMLGVKSGDDLAYPLILPHYTATAWYHKQLPPDLQSKALRDVLDEAEEFALNDYTLALIRGNDLTENEKNTVADKLARYTGLSTEYIKRSNLRVSRTRFRKELLRHEDLTVGRLDSRYKGKDKDSVGEVNEFDPAMAAWNGPFTGAVNRYFREELKYETDLSYDIFGNVHPWKGMSEAHVGEALRRAMTQNPFLKVLVLEGYYDGACDYFSAEYTFSHLDLRGDWKDRLRFDYYECGHMMYLRKADLAKAKKDLENFIVSAVPK